MDIIIVVLHNVLWFELAFAVHSICRKLEWSDVNFVVNPFSPPYPQSWQEFTREQGKFVSASSSQIILPFTFFHSIESTSNKEQSRIFELRSYQLKVCMCCIMYALELGPNSIEICTNHPLK